MSDYGWEKAEKGLRTLRDPTAGDMRQRLLTAWATQLCRINPARDLPADLQAGWSMVRDTLDWPDALTDEGLGADEQMSWAGRLTTLPDDEVGGIADELASLCDEIVRRGNP